VTVNGPLATVRENEAPRTERYVKAVEASARTERVKVGD